MIRHLTSRRSSDLCEVRCLVVAVTSAVALPVNLNLTVPVAVDAAVDVAWAVSALNPRSLSPAAVADTLGPS